MSLLRRRYGAHPLHLLVLLASFAVTGYAVQRLVADKPLRVSLWFVGAAVLHDLVLFPLYALVDLSLVTAWRRRGHAELPAAPWINYLRVPAALSGLLLLVFAPLIFRLTTIYRPTTDLSSTVYLDRWLLVTGVLFGFSALAYAGSLRRSRRERSAAPDLVAPDA